MNQINPFAERPFEAHQTHQTSPQMAPPTSPQFGAVGGFAAADLVTLKRGGARPLSFRGTELCMAMSFVPGAPNWYEIDVWRTVEQRFVLAIKQFFRDENEIDQVHAWEFESFDAVMAHLEAYDPAEDVRVDVDPGAAMSLPELAAHAFALRARAEEARRQFRGLVGEILYDLENEG